MSKQALADQQSNEASSRDFLVEIGTEELPPKALLSLSRSFQASVATSLKKESLAFSSIRPFASPRRLALLVSDLVEHQADKDSVRFGPAIAAAYDAAGEPTKAALGFARSCGVDVSDLGSGEKDGVEKLSYSATQVGKQTACLLPDIVIKALAQLPIPKRMRWGSSRDEFVRPVHWAILLYGNEKLPAEILGIQTGTTTVGHRFHHNHEIEIDQPANYETLLEKPGHVIADFERRKEMIRQLVVAQGESIGATAVVDEELLNEVTGLVEYPVALTGEFEEHFLDVPAEAIILAMKSHQKYFCLVDEDSNLLPRFITVSNIQSTDPAQVIQGNERVIRPRLADARFFFETDKQQSLDSRLEHLKKIVFQEKLGSVYDKSQRVADLAATIAAMLGANIDHCRRAAMLSKCDLVTNMVGEFADLQGLMGSYYAQHDGEPEEVATALSEQYMPRFSGDSLPKSITGSILALADKLDTIVGLFAIGQPPTGSKDPFALRRAAIGILRILVETKLDLNILECIDDAISRFPQIESAADARMPVFDFLLERFRAWYLEEGVSSEVFQSVMALKPQSPIDFHHRVLAVSHFASLPESQALASANKRVSNILAKLVQSSDDSAPEAQPPIAVDEALLQEADELALHKKLSLKVVDVAPLFENGQYKEGLVELVELKEAVDSFFDNVLVMCDDPALRRNRVALLQRLRNLFLQVADISFLHSS